MTRQDVYDLCSEKICQEVKNYRLIDESGRVRVINDTVWLVTPLLPEWRNGMTVTHIAILPKYCESCKRNFVFERYIKKYKPFGTEERPLPVYYCLRCFRQILEEVIALKEGEQE